jgi:O-antigen/teichoic acid export membrane protein
MELVMRSFAAILLTAMFGYVGAAAASPLAWIGSTVVLVFSYLKAIKRLKQLEAGLSPEMLDQKPAKASL